MKKTIVFDKKQKFVLKEAFKLIKRRLGSVDNVKVIEQRNIKGRLISPQGWDVTGLKVHGYMRETKAIIIPSEPNINEVLHEYGHYLFHKHPELEKVGIPASYPIKNGTAEEYNVMYGSNDEWFAYHFAFWIQNKTKDWHLIEKKIFKEMISVVKRKSGTY